MSRGTKADGEIREERGGNGGKDSHREIGQKKEEMDGEKQMRRVDTRGPLIQV